MKISEIDWKWKTGLGVRARTDYVVLHHAAAKVCSPYQIDSWHKANGWSGIGYHYFIRKDGSIYRGRPEWAIGAHASGKNNESIGVCVEGDYSKERTMPEAQKRAVKEVLAYLKSKYPKAGIKGHKEVGATGCPGEFYPLQEMKYYWSNMRESEGLTVTQYEELKKEIQHLSESVSKLSEEISILENPMIYNYIDKNMPEYARPTIQKLVDKGILQGDENGLGLTDDLLRVLVINDRAGLYD